MSTIVQSPGRALTAVRQPSARGERFVLPVAVVLAAIIAIAGWMLLVSPVRQDTSALSAQASTASQQADALQRQLTTLQAQAANLPRYRAELAAAKAALPVDSGMPTLLRTLQSLGTSTGTSVTALTATAPTLMDANGAQNNGATSSIARPGAVYQIPVTLTVHGSTTGLTAFLAGLQGTAPRALLVTAVHLADAEGGQQLDVTATAFLQPLAATSGGR